MPPDLDSCRLPLNEKASVNEAVQGLCKPAGHFSMKRACHRAEQAAA